MSSTARLGAWLPPRVKVRRQRLASGEAATSHSAPSQAAAASPRKPVRKRVGGPAATAWLSEALGAETHTVTAQS